MVFVAKQIGIGWHDSPGARLALQVINHLEKAGFATKVAGGAVRDLLIGRSPADFDLATTAVPQVAQRILEEQRLRVIPTGIDYGTLTVVKAGKTVEVTTLRRDVATDGRRAVVAYSTDFAEDAARRDFTINAMYLTASGQVEDYFSGITDIDQRLLQFVGTPARRLDEDTLRLLRFFRFVAQLGLRFRLEDLATLRSRVENLSGISSERITAELLRILVAPDFERAWGAMAEIGVVQQVLGAGWARSPKWFAAPRSSPAPFLAFWRLAALLDLDVDLDVDLDEQASCGTSSKALTNCLERLSWSRAERRQLLLIVQIVRIVAQKAAQQSTGENRLTAEDYAFTYDLSQTSEIGASAPGYLREINTPASRQMAATLKHLEQVGPLPYNGSDIRRLCPEIQGRDMGEALTTLKAAWAAKNAPSADELASWLAARQEL